MDTVLALTDFSPRAEHAASYALQIAQKTGSNLLLYNSLYEVHNVPDLSGTMGYYQNLALIREDSQKKLKILEERLREKANPEGGQVIVKISSMAEPGSLGSRVQHLLSTEKIELIVMGSKEQNDMFDRLVFKSETYEIIRKATCPILIVPEKTDFIPFKKILFATDLSKSDYIALHFLRRMANVFDSDITIVHVTSSDNATIDEERKRNYLKDIKSQLDYYEVNYIDIPGDNIAVALATLSRYEKVDVLALTHQKRSFIQSLFHHSTTFEIVNFEDLPLLIFPEKF
jgi:nucleotide-binding universal stress UspA family protein